MTRVWHDLSPAQRQLLIEIADGQPHLVSRRRLKSAVALKRRRLANWSWSPGWVIRVKIWQRGRHILDGVAQ